MPVKNITIQTDEVVTGKRPFKGRTYQEEDGLYMSVTSILHPDGLDFPPLLLRQYASYGTIIHSMVEHYLIHKEIPDPVSVSKQRDLNNVFGGSLNLQLDDCNVQGFFEEHGSRIKMQKQEMKVKHRVHKYAGRLDILGTFDGVLSVMDIKTSRNYTKRKLKDYWMQQAAYAHCLEDIPKQMVILPLNPKSDKGYDDPIIETDISKYFIMFLEQLAYVRNNYIL